VPVLRRTFIGFMWPLLALRESFYLSLQMILCGFVLAWYTARILNVASNIKKPNHTSLNENYVVPCICLRAI